MFKFVFNLLFDAPDSNAVAPLSDSKRGQPSTVEDDLKFLREGKDKDDSQEDDDSSEDDDNSESDGADDVDDSDSEESDNEEESDEDGEADDSENDNDSEEEDESEESDDTKSTQGIVTVKDITKDFPDFFKKHPEVRGIIHRERQYSEVFATPAEAQTAASKSDTFDKISEDLITNGDIEPLFEAVKGSKANPKAFGKLISGLLPALQKIDADLYMKLASVPIKRALRAAKSAALKNGNKNLANSVDHLHQYIFDDDDVNARAEFETTTKAEKSEAETKFEKRLAELDARDHGNFKNAVDGEWLNGIKTSFMEKLDPDNRLSDWMKDKMLEDCVLEINKQLVADSRHMRNMEHLWKQAKASGYNSESKTRIVNAALARAKQILPEVRAKLRSTAFNEKKKSKEVNKGSKKFVASNNNSNNKRVPQKGDVKKTSHMTELEALRS